MNNSIFYFFYNFAHQSTFVDSLIVFCAHVLPYLTMCLVFIFLIIHHDIFSPRNTAGERMRKIQEIVFVFVVSGLAWVVSKILKYIIHTDRPFDALSNVQSLIVETGYAFPSGHATFFAALAMSMYLIHKKVGYVCIALAILIGLARIAAGVHFPGDILGGFILGSFIAYFVKNV